MKKFIIPTLILTIGVGIAGISSVSAATVAPTSAQIIAKSDTAIAARIASLNKLSARIAKFKHLTADQVTSLNATVQSSITAMNSLKAKIDGETDLTTLTSDYASITKDYRIYMVVLPDENTIAATDNAIGTIATDQTALATLQARITTATTAGKDTTVVQASYADATAKLADAQTQSNALITAVSSLKVDMGDKTIEASNKTEVAAAKVARTNMLADLAAAKKDIASIRAGLKTLKV
jgi:hypothetical protein